MFAFQTSGVPLFHAKGLNFEPIHTCLTHRPREAQYKSDTDSKHYQAVCDLCFAVQWFLIVDFVDDNVVSLNVKGLDTYQFKLFSLSLPLSLFFPLCSSLLFPPLPFPPFVPPSSYQDFHMPGKASLLSSTSGLLYFE